MQKLGYQFDNQGNVTCVTGTFNASQSQEYLTAQVCIQQSDLPEGKTFDDLTRKELDNMCRQRLAALTAVVDDTTEKPAE